MITLYTSIRSTGRPTRTDVEIAFRDDERCKGMKLVEYTSTVDQFRSNMDDYTAYHNLNADWYDVQAVFE